MKETKCFKKENGVTREVEQTLCTDHNYYFVANDNCFNGVFDESEYNNYLKNKFCTLIRTISNWVVSQKCGKTVFSELNKADDYSTLSHIADTIIEMAKMYHDQKLDELKREYDTVDYKEATKVNSFIDVLINEKKTDSKTITSIVIKQFIYNYFSYIVENLSDEDFFAIEYAKEKNNKELVLSLLNIEKLNENFKDYALNVVFEVIDKSYERHGKHLCWENCKHANALECKKVFDKVKKNIDEYDFIKSGYQVFDGENGVSVFSVIECENYEKSDGQWLTKKEIENLTKTLSLRFMDKK